MINIQIEWLPMGSVVKVKDVDFPLAIMSRFQKRVDEDEIFDYAALPYPTALDDSTKSVLFNAPDIEHVLFVGYRNEAELEWCKDLTKAKEELEKQDYLI